MRFTEFGKGVYGPSRLKPLEGSNISKTGNHVQQYERQHGLNPPDPDWIRLRFARPALTGENPYGSKKQP